MKYGLFRDGCVKKLLATYLDYISSKEEVVKSLQFGEGSLLNYYYHYVWEYLNKEYSLRIPYDFDKSIEKIYEDIREALKKLKNDEIERLIGEFIAGFRDFTSSFKEILYQEKNNYLKLLIYMLKPTARLYPLLIGLQIQGNLDEFLKLIEMTDMYVYKAAGTTARTDLYKRVISEIIFLKDKPNNKQGVKGQLRDFIKRHRGSCENIHTQLTKYILWNYEKEINENFNLLDFELYEEIQIEHVIPRTNDDYISYGFKDDRAEYDQFINKIGNLTILEGRLNKKAENLSPKEKADVYLSGYGEGRGSVLKINKDLAHAIKYKYNGFTKRQIEERTKELLDFIEGKWST